ncbi:MAG: T9SS type A sorting domain-containing protein [Bacteroidia bacterium]|nr:T9SS type A sorting domain-containing protein [Bacteroidia bacterium]
MNLLKNLLIILSIIVSQTISAQTWTQQGSDIDGDSTFDQSGFSVSLSSDGSTVAIGAPYTNSVGRDAGHVRIYKNINGTWTQQGSDIDGEAAVDYSGGSVSLSSDGSTVAIGAAANDGNGSNAGHLRIYKNISGTWTQQGSDIDGEAADDKSGFSVSLSSYGSTVAIGAYRNSGNEAVAGHVRVYNSNTFSTDNITACNSYTWTDGITYTASNTTAKDTFLNTAGRDSIVTLNLTMNSSSSSTDNITACNSYTWTNGVTYTSSNNTATDTFVNTAGCDSVVMLSLTVIETNKLISTQPEDQSVDVNKSTNIIVTSGYGDVATYQWQVDDGAGFKDLSNVGQYSGVLTDTLLVSNVTLLNDGEIFRCLVTVNDCSDTSETVLLTIGKVDVSELALTKDYAVYPNPTKGIVFISTKASLLGASYTVYSSSGALIRNGSITSEITTLDIQDLQEGIYFIQLGDDIQQSFKIIKK